MSFLCVLRLSRLAFEILCFGLAIGFLPPTHASACLLVGRDSSADLILLILFLGSFFKVVLQNRKTWIWLISDTKALPDIEILATAGTEPSTSKGAERMHWNRQDDLLADQVIKLDGIP